MESKAIMFADVGLVRRIPRGGGNRPTPAQRVLALKIAYYVPGFKLKADLFTVPGQSLSTPRDGGVLRERTASFVADSDHRREESMGPTGRRPPQP